MIAARGKVYLVGAGPGDPELLTLKAVRAIGAADVVMHDDLINPAILAYARPGARVIAVGKRGGCKSTPQAFIERLMAQAAGAGAVVARVKGGDPFMFGRGGEERDALHAAGIEVEVIQGVTSGIAAPAAIGIPVTHRDVTRGVAFVTGHAKSGGDEPNWAALAASGLTLVVYMGVANIEHIAAALQAGGLRADTPAAAIQNASLAGQCATVATLATLAAAIRAEHIASPAIIVIGDVVRYATLAADHGSSQRPSGDRKQNVRGFA